MTQYTNEEWLDLLGGEPDQAALAELREMLVRGLRYTLSSRVKSNLDPLTEDFVQDALLKILDKLETFRGESQFTTWAQKVAVRVALTDLRRKRWRDFSLEEMTTSPDGSVLEPAFMSDPSPSPERQTAQQAMFDLVRRLLDDLTDRQRQAVMLVMVSGLPMDVVADQMDTNRNALYKLIHDARLRLKRRLEEEGLSPEDVLAVFG